jgi:hypothetical protein
MEIEAIQMKANLKSMLCFFSENPGAAHPLGSPTTTVTKRLNAPQSLCIPNDSQPSLESILKN